MSRRQARELALQALFQLDFNSDAETIASREAQEKAIEAAVAELENGNITASMAVYELKFDEEKTDVGVVVNEAIELAKKYGTDDSSRFINGVLAGVNSKG